MNFWLKYILIDLTLGVCIALLLRRFVCVLCYVKGKSMMDTLQDGEVLFALRRHKMPRRFDIVICRYPKRKGLFVKRVIGLSGETIAIEEDVLLVNGMPVEENFARRRHLAPMTERTVDEGAYFLMGDNRTASRDSRSVGCIAEKDIIAVAKCVVFPFNKIRIIG